MKYLHNNEAKSQGQIRKIFKNVSLPRVWDQSVFDTLGIVPILPTPRPQPSSPLKQVVSNGTVVDGLGNTVEAWSEVDIAFDTPQDQQDYLDALLTSAKERKQAELDALALEKEEAGLTIAGVDISTKRGDQARMTTALSLMGRKTNATKRFKAKNGWATVNKSALEAMQDALEAHIEAVTTQHEAHEAAINALTTAQEVNDYDITVGW